MSPPRYITCSSVAGKELARPAGRSRQAHRSARTITSTGSPAARPPSGPRSTCWPSPTSHTISPPAHARHPAGQHVRLPEELGDEGGRRRLVDLARRAHLLDPPRVHDDHAVARATSASSWSCVTKIVVMPDRLQDAPPAPCASPGGAWRRGSTAARRAAGSRGGSPAPGPGPPAAAGRPRAGAGSGRPGGRGARAPAPRATRRRSVARRETRRMRRPKATFSATGQVGETGRSSGTPCRCSAGAAGHAARRRGPRSGSSPRRASGSPRPG